MADAGGVRSGDGTSELRQHPWGGACGAEPLRCLINFGVGSRFAVLKYVSVSISASRSRPEADFLEAANGQVFLATDLFRQVRLEPPTAHDVLC